LFIQRFQQKRKQIKDLLSKSRSTLETHKYFSKTALNVPIGCTIKITYGNSESAKMKKKLKIFQSPGVLWKPTNTSQKQLLMCLFDAR
jgi:hypothetical protein